MFSNIFIGRDWRDDSPLRWWEYLAFMAIVGAIATVISLWLPGLVYAADDTVPPDATRLFLPKTQLLVIVVASLSPAVTYLLNKNAPWISEPVKAVVFVVVAAISGVLTVLVDTGGISVDWNTGQLLVTAIVAALASHFGFWKPSTIGHSLGAGRNKQDE